MPLELRYIRGIYENWLRYNYTYTTYKRNVLTLEDFFGFFPEKSSPMSFLPGDVFRYIKARQTKKNLRTHLRLISKFFRWMIDHDYTTFDPVPAALRHPRIPQLPDKPEPAQRNRLGRQLAERERLLGQLVLAEQHHSQTDTPPLPLDPPEQISAPAEAGNSDTTQLGPRFPHNPPIAEPQPAPRIVYVRGWGRPAPEVYPQLSELLSQAPNPTLVLLVRLAYEIPLRAIQLSSLTRADFSSGSLIIPPKNQYLPSGTFNVSGEILKIVATLPDGPIFGQTNLDKLSYQFRRVAYRAGYDCTLTEWILHCIRLRREDKWIPPPAASGKRAQKTLEVALEHLQHPSSSDFQAPQYTIEPQPAD